MLIGKLFAEHVCRQIHEEKEAIKSSTDYCAATTSKYEGF